ncbi:MAG: EscU/YscU/HrcU family type III secretion system export apparatus switch protein [Treponema sp.]|nr:EscU/YscU/HrcU family type III secretion system export apparatus switch protein [Treponema sp.]
MAKKIVDIVSQADCFITDGESKVAGLKILRKKKCFEVIFIGGKRYLAVAKKNAAKCNKKIGGLDKEAFDFYLCVGQGVRAYELCNHYFGMKKSQYNDLFKKIIAKCDCLVVGQEKYAVGLRYNEKTMDAPKVVYQDLYIGFAKRFAREVKVKVFENRPIARGLLLDCPLDCEIPETYYKCVSMLYQKLPKFMPKGGKKNERKENQKPKTKSRAKKARAKKSEEKASNK